MNAVRHALALLLSLILLIPLNALAESPQMPPNNLSLTLTDFSIPSPGVAAGQDLSLHLSLGADRTGAGVIGSASLLSGEEEIASLAASLEGNAFNAVLSTLEEGVSLSQTDAAAWLTRLILPAGEETAALQKAISRLFLTLKDGFSFAAPDPQDFLIDETVWAEYLTSHAERPCLVHEGAAEVTLFDRTYTAQKYTYDTGRMNWQAYLNESIQRAGDLLFADVNLSLAESAKEIFKALTETENPFLSIADNEYTRMGTLYLLDDGSGLIETTTLITHTPNGDESQTTAYAELYQKGGVQIEIRTGDPANGTTVEQRISLTPVESGIDCLYAVDSYSAAAVSPEDGSLHVEVSSARHSFCFNETTLSVSSMFTSQASGGISTDEGFLLELTADPETAGHATGSLSLHRKNGETDWSAAARLDAEFTRLPDGPLLTLPGEPIDPVRSGGDQRNLADSAVSSLISKVIFSFVTPGDLLNSLLAP